MAVNLHIGEVSKPIGLSVGESSGVQMEVHGEFIGGGGEEFEGAYVYDPSESEQVVLINGKVATDDITIRAVPSDYVGSDIPVRSSSDVIVSGDTVTTPGGYYADEVQKSVASGSATTPTGSFEQNPTITVDGNGLITASYSKTESVTPIVSEGYVTSGTAGNITFAGTATQQMTKRTSSDLNASGNTVTAPAGYYPSSASKAVASGSATTPSTSITANPSISVSNTGLISASVSASQSVTPSVSAGYVSSGTAGTVSVSGSNTEQLETQGGSTITPTTSEQTAVPAGTFVTGDVKVSAMPNGVRGTRTNRQNWTSTKSVYTIEYPDATNGYYPGSTVAAPGSIELTRQTETVTPTESQQVVTPTNSYHFLEKVTVNPISSTYIGSDVTQRDSTDLSASGATVSVPSGYYANNESKAVSSGTEGTPTATKGTVSSHSVAVTPSVTNTAGYVSGGTHNGTPVTVSASELVSGNLPITSNGNNIDVTNFATVSVAVPGSSPSLQNKSKSYTPTESAQSETISADSGYDGLGNVDVSVGAISSTYVGSGITQRTSSDLSVNNDTVTAPAGYYASSASKAVASGTVALPTALASSGGATVSSNGTEITLSKSMSLMASVPTPGYVSSVPASTADVTLRATDANFLAENIKSGVTLFGKAGSYTGGGGGSGLTLLKTYSMGSLSTTSTSAADTGKTTTLTGYNDYDVLVVDVSVDSPTNNRHTSTVSMVYLTGTSNVTTKNTYTVGSNKWNSRLSSSGTGSTRQSTTAYGIYVNTATVSSSTMTLTFYYKYNNNNTGTINGSYTARIYGLKLYDLIGG